MDPVVPSQEVGLGYIIYYNLEGFLYLLRQWPWIHREINRWRNESTSKIPREELWRSPHCWIWKLTITQWGYDPHLMTLKPRKIDMDQDDQEYHPLWMVYPFGNQPHGLLEHPPLSSLVSPVFRNLRVIHREISRKKIRHWGSGDQPYAQQDFC